MIYSFYFSPTGGTKRVMDILTNEFFSIAKESGLKNVQELKTVEFTNRFSCLDSLEIGEEDICFVGVPSFGGRVPEPAINRIAEVNGRGALVIPVVVYGNRAFDDTLLELKNQLYGSHFCPAAAVAAVAEHSILRQYGAGRPDVEDAKELEEFAAIIWKHLEAKNLRAGGKYSSDFVDELVVPGNEPYVERKPAALQPEAGGECKSCGICAEQCPVGAIPSENPNETNSSVCIGCMRCIQICPHKARNVSSVKLTAAGIMMKKVLEERKENHLYI